MVVKTAGIQRNVMFACLYSRGFWINVGLATQKDPDSATVRTTVPRVAGSRVAYVQAVSWREAGTAVRVVDLRRVPRRNAVATVDPVYGERDVLMSGTDLELKPNGSVAWIWRGVRGGQQVIEVHKRDADGHALLDVGAEIDVRSLARADSTLYWTKAGVPQSAQLR